MYRAEPKAGPEITQWWFKKLSNKLSKIPF
jgi:hypothetical protein